MWLRRFRSELFRSDSLRPLRSAGRSWTVAPEVQDWLPGKLSAKRQRESLRSASAQSPRTPCLTRPRVLRETGSALPEKVRSHNGLSAHWRARSASLRAIPNWSHLRFEGLGSRLPPRLGPRLPPPCFDTS